CNANGFSQKKINGKTIKIDNYCINNHNKDLRHSGVIVAVNLNAASAQKPERTQVREDFDHCPSSK
ncbi:hypothetical protein, partial [Yersinia frederiksenii]|uniref:hypothetical protein n=1 Tax=Yersinia frederiksenii TaxID=29484 RepID=UPI001C97C05E